MAPEIQESEPASVGQGVGRLLRETRERLGHTLPAVAATLRIRQPYLQAIEAGRFEKLPGSAYVGGFVRSYADYLGLDGNEIVRRFKLESGGAFSSRAELVFPSAVSDGSFPTGSVLLLGLAVMVVVYGVWYWSSRDDSVSETVPPLPDRLAALIHRPVGTGSETVPVPQQQPLTPSPSMAAPAETAVPVQPPAAVPPPSHEDVVPPNEGESAASSPAATAPASASVPAAAAPAAPAEALKDQDGAQGQAQRSSHAADEPVAVPADAARIILKANDDCWIRIRDASGAIIHSGILRKGTSLRVTSHPGQTLTAGNAAALTVLVDNRPIAPLGGEGKVRRNLPLDPDKIGKAAGEVPPDAGAPDAAPIRNPTE